MMPPHISFKSKNHTFHSHGDDMTIDITIEKLGNVHS